MKLAFGKYGGTPIEKVPQEYLEYLIHSNRENIKTWEQELKRWEVAG